MKKAYFIFIHSRDGKLNPYSVLDSNQENGVSEFKFITLEKIKTQNKEEKLEK